MVLFSESFEAIKPFRPSYGVLFFKVCFLLIPNVIYANSNISIPILYFLISSKQSAIRLKQSIRIILSY